MFLSVIKSFSGFSPLCLKGKFSPGRIRHYMTCPSPVTSYKFFSLLNVLATIGFWIFLNTPNLCPPCSLYISLSCSGYIFRPSRCTGTFFSVADFPQDSPEPFLGPYLTSPPLLIFSAPFPISGFY